MSESLQAADLPRYFGYWGKAQPVSDGGPQFHLLPYHCLDVAAVGDVYLSRAPALCSFLADRLGAPSPGALRSWLVYWLALHDLGKFAESFQGQRADLWSHLQRVETKRPYTVRHDTLGHQLWCSRLGALMLEEQWFGPLNEDHEDGLACWSAAVTGHHGQPPGQVLAPITTAYRTEDICAATAFARDVRVLLLAGQPADWVARLHPESFRLASVGVSWWVAGLAVLADWVGSNADVFAYCDQPWGSLAGYWQRARDLAVRALSHSGVLPAAQPQGRTFHQLFPSIRVPSPLQQWATDAPLERGPQVHLLEDVTGAGKTEAALTLTHRLIASGEADGFFIGLPTMATANAMYQRVSHVFGELFGEDASLVLAHGRKRLVEAFAESVIVPGRSDRDRMQADESATSRCTAWLADHNKRALLAAGGVGTLDQALLAALQSRHQSLRLLGLFRKVLVVDEVHACDAYMQGVLETLLRLHAQAGGSAVLLSATLPQRMKSQLLAAFAKGCAESAPALSRQEYPLVTSWTPGAAHATEVPIPARAEVRRHVGVRYESDRATLMEAVVEGLRAGRCAAWICNTIGDALALHESFAAHLPGQDITLFHARFALGDRLAIEEKVLERFGPDSGPEHRRGQLLIATQVAEQSLDVDFDLLVSDLAPIDRLIQRAGRLRRHVRDVQGQRLRQPGVREGRGDAQMWVFGPAWVEQPPANWLSAVMRGTSHVYPHHAQLWLTARALRAGQLRMPDDARSLIEGVFGDDEGAPAGLRGNANRAEGQAYGDRSLAQLNCVKPECGYERRGSEWLADSSAPSRLGEDTQEVLLARWVGDRLEPWVPHEVERYAWAYSSVRVPRRLIEEAVWPDASARRAAMEAVLGDLGALAKWSVLLPFERDAAQWWARAKSASRGDRGGTEVWWSYASERGLTRKPSGDQPDGFPHEV